jgi:8-oxo-dGTP pyrophosphatase MutT (NUDIX family)
MVTDQPRTSIWAVVALIEHPSGDGRFLAINRPGRPHDVAMIGGKIDAGETTEQALVREVREETGIVIDPTSLAWLYDRLDPSVGKVARCFLVARWEGEPRTCEPGLVVRWATETDLVDHRNTFCEWSRVAIARARLLGAEAELRRLRADVDTWKQQIKEEREWATSLGDVNFSAGLAKAQEIMVEANCFPQSSPAGRGTDV